MHPEEIRVHLDPADIVEGQPRSSAQNPLRLALHDLGYAQITLRPDSVGIDGVWYALDPDAQEWLRQFDANESVGPVWFTLRRLDDAGR